MVQTPITGLRILVVSDVHYALDDNEYALVNDKYDACFVLGDIPKPILTILSGHDYPVFGVLGNHDTGEFFNETDIINLHSIKQTVAGYDIAGIEGSVRYKSGPYVMHDQKEIQEIAKTLPQAQILLSHDSPWHMHDTAVNKEGFVGITKYIEQNKPLLHIYGHHHQFHTQQIKDTLCICNYRFGILQPDGIFLTFEDIFPKST